MTSAKAEQPQAVALARNSARERLIEWLDPPSDFNFQHYRGRHMLAELLRGIGTPVVPPGTKAPDFELVSTSGERVRLSRLRNKPVLLHFVSYTCPVTRGGAPIIRELHQRYGDRVTFIDMMVRQAHPGENHGGYLDFAQKQADAAAYQREELIAWPVVVDELDGATQIAYGGTAASAYLIDTEGDVSFCAVWGQSPLLREALNGLLARNGTGVSASKRIDRVPHLGPAIVYGRRGPASGGRRALIDLELGFPGASLLMAFGWIARPVLGPLVLRTTPLPARTRNFLIAASLTLGLALFLCSRFEQQRGKR